jgi:hypothetical protein
MIHPQSNVCGWSGLTVDRVFYFFSPEQPLSPSWFSASASWVAEKVIGAAAKRQLAITVNEVSLLC